jgi:hypothetical protein
MHGKCRILLYRACIIRATITARRAATASSRHPFSASSFWAAFHSESEALAWRPMRRWLAATHQVLPNCFSVPRWLRRRPFSFLLVGCDGLDGAALADRDRRRRIHEIGPPGANLA